MKTQDLQNRKLAIISVITSLEDKSILEKVWNLLAVSSGQEKVDSKETNLEKIQAGIEEMKLVEQGKAKARPLTELLNEL